MKMLNYNALIMLHNAKRIFPGYSISIEQFGTRASIPTEETVEVDKIFPKKINIRIWDDITKSQVETFVRMLEAFRDGRSYRVVWVP